MQGGIFEYGAPGAGKSMWNMSNADYDKIHEDTPVTVQGPKRRHDLNAKIRIPRQPQQQEDPEVLQRRVADSVSETRTHLIELVKSPSFLAAMAHVCSLTHRMDWATGSSPGGVIQWGRKAWSHENHFAAVGVSIGPGNHVMSIMMLAIRHALGMEPLLEARACAADIQNAAPRRPVGWPGENEHKCEQHPLLAGATAAGISCKEGCMKPISSFTKKNIPPEACLRLVLATLAHDEPGQRVTLQEHISTDAQERLGDILEAAGGVLGPYTPAAKSMTATVHDAHGLNQRSDTNALTKLSKLAVEITELSYMLYNPRDPGDAALRMFDVIHKLGADAAALKPEDHGNRCWVCAELRRLDESDLLITADEERRNTKIPTVKAKTKTTLGARRSKVAILTARTKRGKNGHRRRLPHGRGDSANARDHPRHQAA